MCTILHIYIMRRKGRPSPFRFRFVYGQNGAWWSKNFITIYLIRSNAVKYSIFSIQLLSLHTGTILYILPWWILSCMAWVTKCLHQMHKFNNKADGLIFTLVFLLIVHKSGKIDLRNLLKWIHGGRLPLWNRWIWDQNMILSTKQYYYYAFGEWNKTISFDCFVHRFKS